MRAFWAAGPSDGGVALGRGAEERGAFVLPQGVAAECEAADGVATDGDDEGFLARVFHGGGEGAIQFECFAQGVFAVVDLGGLRDERLVHDEDVAAAVRLQTLDGAAHEVAERGLRNAGVALLAECERAAGEETEQRAVAIGGCVFQLQLVAHDLASAGLQKTARVFAPPAFVGREKIIRASTEEDVEFRRVHQRGSECVAVGAAGGVGVKSGGRRVGQAAIGDDAYGAAFLARKLQQ